MTRGRSVFACSPIPNQAAVDIVFALIIAFVNFKVPDTVMMSLIIYIVVLALLIVSIVRIHGYRLQCRSIQGGFNR